ncbi:MAG: HutD family protein [Putridiphycobacter sp.]
MKIIKKEEVVSKKWSGGTTSQLYIYPEHAQYQKLNFDFRLSKATIDVDHSIFTPLPGVKRKLFLLDGEIELIHKNRSKIKLKPYEYADFLGDWETTCLGKATDFNLMMTGRVNGNYLVYTTQDTPTLNHTIQHDFTIYYVISGQLSFLDSTILKGELLILERHDFEAIELALNEQTKILKIEIDLA